MARRHIPDGYFDRMAELYLVVDAAGQPLHTWATIGAILDSEYGIRMDKCAMSRAAKRLGWQALRKQIVADATIQATEQTQSKKQVPKLTVIRNGEAPRDADDHLSEQEQQLKRARNAIISHLGDYISGTRKVTGVALQALEAELKIHVRTMNEVIELLTKKNVPITDKRIGRLRKHMLSPLVLVQVAKLGQILTNAQLNIVLTQIDMISDERAVVGWADDVAMPAESDGSVLDAEPPLLPMPADFRDDEDD